MSRDQTFARNHRGKFAVRQAGILVHRAFETKYAAAAWAEGNYRHPENWVVVQL